MEPFRHHVFVCSQVKAEGVTSCSASGSGGILAALSKTLTEHVLDDEVQVTTCGCMGLCDDGPVMIVYPEGIWYRKLQPSDVEEIVKSHLKDGAIVSRLEWRDAAAMKSAALEHRNQYRAMLQAKDKAGTLPDDLTELVRSYMPSRVMLSALELDIFSAVGDGATSEDVARIADTNKRATEILLNALVSLGLLTKSNGTFACTAITSRFFRSGSKDNARPGLLHTANLWRRWSFLTEVVRTGEPAPASVRHESWTQNFIAAMDRNANERAGLVLRSIGTDGVRRILDLGGGSGAYSIAFAKASPEVEAVILDVPEVIGLTQEYVQRQSVNGRIRFRAGDMLTSPLDSGYDLVLLNAICHMFSPAENRALLKRAYASLAPHGRVVIQDFILNPDKASPRQAALFSINMLVGTDGGSSYCEREYTEWLREAGFTEVDRVRLPGPSHLIVAHRP